MLHHVLTSSHQYSIGMKQKNILLKWVENLSTKGSDVSNELQASDNQEVSPNPTVESASTIDAECPNSPTPLAVSR